MAGYIIIGVLSLAVVYLLAANWSLSGDLLTAERKIKRMERDHQGKLDKLRNQQFRLGRDAGHAEALLEVEDYFREAEDQHNKALEEAKYQRWVNTQLWEEISPSGRRRIERLLNPEPERRNGNGHYDEDAPDWVLAQDEYHGR